MADNSEWVARARTIAASLAANAAERDAAGQLPFAEIEVLRDSGLLPLLVPTERGGLGGRWSDVLTLTRIIAAADGSIGHLFGYHFLNHLSAAWPATAAQRDALERALVQSRWFLGDAVNPLDPSLTVSREGDTITLSGKKNFATGAAVGNGVLIVFQIDGKPVSVLLPRDHPGLKPNDDWRNMGQKLTASGSLSFETVRIPVDMVLGQALDAPAAEERNSPMSAMIQSVLSSVQLGIAEGALEAGMAYTRSSSRAWFKSGVARATDDPLIVAPYGRLAARLAAARALGNELALRLDAAIADRTSLSADARAELSVAAFTFKIVSTDVALETTQKIFELMGARATTSRFGFDRFWRNARVLTLHDPVVYKELEVGAYVLNGTHPQPSAYS